MNQEIHEANKKRIRRKQWTGIALAVAGLIVTGVAFLVRSNLLTVGIILVLVGAVYFAIHLRRGIAYARMEEEQAQRPKSEAERLAEQRAKEVEEEGLHTGTQDIVARDKEHMGLGVLGAVIGGLAGGLVWAFIMSLGYVTVYGGIVMLLLSFGGYELFSMNRGTEGMAASVITSVLMLPFATYAGFVWYFYRELLSFSKLSFVAMWQQGWGLIGKYELGGAFFKSLGNGYLFMAVAAFFTYRIISRIEMGRS